MLVQDVCGSVLPAPGILIAGTVFMVLTDSKAELESLHWKTCNNAYQFMLEIEYNQCSNNPTLLCMCLNVYEIILLKKNKKIKD